MPKGSNQKFKLYRLAQIMQEQTDDEHFTVNVDVHVSRQFLGWVFSLGEDIKIVGPDDVVKQMQKEIERLIKQYTINEQI